MHLPSTFVITVLYFPLLLSRYSFASKFVSHHSESLSTSPPLTILNLLLSCALSSLPTP